MRSEVGLCFGREEKKSVITWLGVIFRFPSIQPGLVTGALLLDLFFFFFFFFFSQGRRCLEVHRHNRAEQTFFVKPTSITCPNIHAM